MSKPYAESCEQNRQPILEVLLEELNNRRSLLEIGSGTGQHAVYFAPHFPGLNWQTSDMPANHAGIRAWLAEAALENILPPLSLDVRNSADWPQQEYDCIYSANAVHIMSWQAVEAMFAGIGQVLQSGGKLILYGPFNYRGEFTSESNARFDLWLKDRDPASGIRDFEALDALAKQQEMQLSHDYTMPANNRILVWHKKTK